MLSFRIIILLQTHALGVNAEAEKEFTPQKSDDAQSDSDDGPDPKPQRHDA